MRARKNVRLLAARQAAVEADGRLIQFFEDALGMNVKDVDGKFKAKLYRRLT